MPTRKPLIIITGFLGSGKTTLLRSLVSSLAGEGLKVDVILNDIANAELDAATVRDAAPVKITPIDASCACCESLEALVSACEDTAQCEAELLLVELNGTGDPLGLLESFTMLEQRLPFSPRLCVCVIDVRHWGLRGELTPLERRQMGAAGLYLLSHTNRSEPADIHRVELALAEEFPNSKRITAKQLADAVIRRSPLSAGERRSPKLQQRAVRGVDGDATDEIHLLSHQVQGCQIPLPPKLRRSSVERLLNKLPDEVLRAKALVKTVEEPGTRWLFERCGTEVSPSPIPVRGVTRLPSSLTCTGIRLNPDAIRNLVSVAFGTAAASGDQNLRSAQDGSSLLDASTK
ncbi:MAG: GTP-binding protein [Verrucomicrobiales bacterium]